MEYEELYEDIEEVIDVDEIDTEEGLSKIVIGLIAAGISAVVYGATELCRGLKTSNMDTAQELEFYEAKKRECMQEILESTISENRKKKLKQKIAKYEKKMNDLSKGA